MVGGVVFMGRMRWISLLAIGVVGVGGAWAEGEESSDLEGIAFFEMSGVMLSLYPRDKLAEDITVSPEGAGFPGFTLAHNLESPEAVDALVRDRLLMSSGLVPSDQGAQS